jgi:hypothetical protein
MSVLWESNENLPAKVRYGQSGHLDQIHQVAPPRIMMGVSTLSQTNVAIERWTNAVPIIKTNVINVSVTNVFYVYEARLVDLRPDTSYSYVVELGSETSLASRFRTFGQSPKEVRFVVYGDSRSQPQIHTAVAHRFAQFRPDFILHTGDLVARGRDYALWGREFFEPLKGIIDHIPLMPSIGNHEEDATNYLAYFPLPPPQRSYSFDLGPVHVLALDYHFEKRSDEQFAFAQQDLRKSQAPWKIVFLHYPMFNVGGHASTWGHEAYLPLFHETHVDLVLAGHSHIYERFHPIVPQGREGAWPIVYFTSGGGGAPLYSVYDHPALACRASTNHFILFEATADRMKGQVYLPSGKILDEFELRKGSAGQFLSSTPEPKVLLSSAQPARNDRDWYPEEWLRTYFEAAPILQGRLASVPSNDAPVQVTFNLKPLTNVPGPVKLEIRLAPDSAEDYQWVGAPLAVSVPATGQPAITARASIRTTGHKAITAAKAGDALSPALVFEARVQSGALDVVARGTRSIFAPPGPDLGPTNAIALADTYPLSRLEKILAPRNQWRPFPTLTDRNDWLALPEAARKALVKHGEQALAQAPPDLPAAIYLEFARNGNRSHYESVYFERRRLLHQLVLAECAEGQGRFLDGIANALWNLCEESSWCIPAHIGAQKAGVGLPDVNESIVDLFAAQTGVSVAWTLYLVGPELDRVSPQVRRRATQEVNRRILTPFLERDFSWMGFNVTTRAGRPNNWNPWINASVLTASLVLEPDNGRRAKLVHRVLQSLDRFLQPYPQDGSCDEGPGYWSRAGGSVLDNLDLLFDSTRGELNVFSHPLIGEMGRFIHRVHIADDWFVDIGDCPAKTSIERDLIYRYGRDIRDRQLQALATSGATLEGLVAADSIDLGRALHTLVDMAEILAGSQASPPLVRDVWLGSEDMQMMIARDHEGSAEGFFVAAWGGHNAQSHNHNDVGNCLLFVDGKPVFIDLGAPTYSAKTFSAHRYDIPAMQSAYHNLPTINGLQQSAGRAFAARQVKHTVSDSSAELTMDIAGAWPAEASVSSWARTVHLERGRELRVQESFELKDVRKETSLHWLTPLTPRVDAPGLVVLPLSAGKVFNHSAVRMRFDPDVLSCNLEPVALDDERLEHVWGKQVTRIVLRPKQIAAKGTWTLHLDLVP